MKQHRPFLERTILPHLPTKRREEARQKIRSAHSFGLISFKRAAECDWNLKAMAFYIRWSATSSGPYSMYVQEKSTKIRYPSSYQQKTEKWREGQPPRTVYALSQSSIDCSFTNDPSLFAKTSSSYEEQQHYLDRFLPCRFV